MNGIHQSRAENPIGSVIEIQSQPQGPITTEPRVHPVIIFPLLVGLAGFALVLGFFPAKSSELLLSLSYGRGLVEGTITLGSEPFSHMLGDFWANPHWLFDVLAFLAFRLDQQEGFVLIACKAAFISFCAVFLTVGIARKSAHCRPVTGLVTALGMLAASPYFDANSNVVAFPMLLMLISLLQTRFEADSKTPWNFCLVLLMAVWANLDSSFVVGLAVWFMSVVLPEGLRPKRYDLLTWFAALIACLAHPFPGRGLIQIPEVLAPIGEVAIRMDPQVVDRLFESGLSLQRFSNSQLALNPAGLAFPALIILGIASFIFNLKACKTWMLPVFLFSLVLAAYRHKAIPMFAGIATGVACLNLIQAISVRNKLAEIASKGGVFTFLLLIIASLLALPGFLHGSGTNHRLPGWGLALRESHKALAQHLANDYSRNSGKALIASLGYPDHAAYVAWFAPGLRTFVDPRLHLFSSNYGDFAALVEALAKPVTTSSEPEPQWRELLKSANVVKVAASLKSMEASLRVLPRFVREPDWESPAIAGGWLVASVRGGPIPQDQLLTAGKRQLASLVDVRLGRDLPQGAPTRTNSFSKWEFWQPRNEPSGHTDSAELCLALMELLNPLPKLGASARALAEARWGLHQVPDAIRANETVFRSLITYGEMAGTSNRPTLLSDLQEIELVSNCRRIISIKPDGNEALQAHGIMAEISNKRRFLDMEVAHRKEVVRLGRQFISKIAKNEGNPENPSGESGKDIATKDLDKVSKQLEELEALLVKRSELYVNELTRIQKTSGREPRGLEKAILAIQLGLIQEASRELDSAATADQVQQNERERTSYLLLNLQLSIQLGRLDEAEDALAGEGVRNALGGSQKSIPHPGLLLPDLLNARKIHPVRMLPAITWMDTQLAAGRGDYQKAADLIGSIVADQMTFFNPLFDRRMADQIGTEPWLTFLARDQGTMEAVANAGSLALKADSFNTTPWLLAMAEALAMIKQEGSEQIQILSAFIAELRVAEGNYLYLCGRPSEAGNSFRQGLALSTHARQIVVQANRLIPSNFWADNILQLAFIDHYQRLFSPITPASETARRMNLLLELTME